MTLVLLLVCTLLTGTRAVANKFAVAGGGCTTNGACFQSLNYPDDYGADESCEITVQSVSAGETLNSAAFNTEYPYDKLVVNGAQYSGTFGLSNVAALVNDVFRWSSDGIRQRSGFEVCLVGPCLETDGSQANADACRCGTATCSSSSGLFCTSSTNTCRQIPTCAVEDGTVANSNDCACGTSVCASGVFCTASLSTCSLCSTGFFIDHVAFVCQACTNVPNATTVTCTTATNQIATSCEPNYFLLEGVCKACTNVPNATTVTCTTATNQIATGCETNYVLLGGGCYGCTATKDAYQIATCSC